MFGGGAVRGENKEIIVGFLALSALLLAMAFLYAGRGHLTGKTPSGRGYAVTATFNRVDGLLPGDVVRLGGIRIGTVEKAEIDRNYRARLTFRIDSAIRLPEDTSAAIHTDGLFGTKFVSLLPGGEDATIKPGGAITYTQDSLIVSELLNLIIAEGHANRPSPAPPGAAQPVPAQGEPKP